VSLDAAPAASFSPLFGKTLRHQLLTYPASAQTTIWCKKRARPRNRRTKEKESILDFSREEDRKWAEERLPELENGILTHRKAFLEVCKALMEIRDHELYKVYDGIDSMKHYVMARLTLRYDGFLEECLKVAPLMEAS
jgi:hypothetical protein